MMRIHYVMNDFAFDTRQLQIMLLFFAVCLFNCWNSIAAAISAEIVSPHGSLLMAGETLNLTCTMTSSATDELYFMKCPDSRDGECFSMKDSQAPTSVRLVIPDVVRWADQGVYLCKTDGLDGEKVLASVRVNVEDLEMNISRVTFNELSGSLDVLWCCEEDRKLICQRAASNYNNRAEEEECDLTSFGSRCYNCHVPDVLMYAGYNFSIDCMSRETQTVISRRQTGFRPVDYCKPAAVQNLTVKEVNNSAISLSWIHDSTLIELHYRIYYQSEWNNSFIEFNKTPDSKPYSINRTILDLKPYTTCNVTVVCRPKDYGLWSDEVSVTIRTGHTDENVTIAASVSVAVVVVVVVLIAVGLAIAKYCHHRHKISEERQQAAAETNTAEMELLQPPEPEPDVESHFYEEIRDVERREDEVREEPSDAESSYAAATMRHTGYFDQLSEFSDAASSSVQRDLGHEDWQEMRTTTERHLTLDIVTDVSEERNSGVAVGAKGGADQFTASDGISGDVQHEESSNNRQTLASVSGDVQLGHLVSSTVETLPNTLLAETSTGHLSVPIEDGSSDFNVDHVYCSAGESSSQSPHVTIAATAAAVSSDDAPTAVNIAEEGAPEKSQSSEDLYCLASLATPQ